MTREEIEKMAIEYDRNLKTHPMSASELRKDLVGFALKVMEGNYTSNILDSDCVVCGKVFREVTKCSNVKCTAPFKKSK